MDNEGDLADECKDNNFGKKFKHTLDSDEEDDEVDAEKYNIMDTNNIEGAEKATVEFDGNIKITPFNMDEELESGHFDKEGTYIFKKEDEIRDNWLDNINWANVQQSSQKKSNSSDDDDEDNMTDKKVDFQDLYKQLIELINPGETIQKAIQRYGKECKLPKKGQKRKLNSEDTSQSKNSDLSKEKMLKLISIADKILQTGDMNIYERKYEEFQLHLNKSTKQESPSNDMFSEDFDVNTKNTSDKIEPLSDQVEWEFKWEDKDDAPIYGPHTSNEMLAWVNEGYFENGVFVRKKGSEDSKFYTSKRIDFELYV